MEKEVGRFLPGDGLARAESVGYLLKDAALEWRDTCRAKFDLFVKNIKSGRYKWGGMVYLYSG